MDIPVVMLEANIVATLGAQSMQAPPRRVSGSGQCCRNGGNVRHLDGDPSWSPVLSATRAAKLVCRSRRNSACEPLDGQGLPRLPLFSSHAGVDKSYLARIAVEVSYDPPSLCRQRLTFGVRPCLSGR